LLTATQRTWLTTAQIRSMAFYDAVYLRPYQISQMSPAQFASVDNSHFLRGLSDLQISAITRTQWFSLPAEVYSSYMHLSDAIAPPAHYHGVDDTPVGPNGLNASPHAAAEWAKVLALVPLEAVTHATIASGDWSDPRIWRNGVVPSRGAKVLISAGTNVRFESWMNQAIDTLRIDGTLRFATNRGTQLKADTIVVNTSGALHVGTATDPIRDDVVARILIADNGPINTIKDPYLFGRGLLSQGEVRMYGKTVTPYVNLAGGFSAGSTILTLAEIPVNWSVGDELVIAGTDPHVWHFKADRVRIQAISGHLVQVDPLQYDHIPPAGYGLSIQVANMTRNIVLRAEDASVVAERPHMAFMHSPNVVLENIGVYGFGRTDKSVRLNDAVVVGGVLQPGTGLNQRARYAIHFHHTGVNPAVAPAVVRGSVVDGSPGWGYVNHQSNVTMDDNVAFGVVGAAFTTEDGNEIGTMRRNLAMSSRGALTSGDRRDIHDFGFAGHGFWLQGPGVALSDNISAGSNSAGFYIMTASSKANFDAVNLTDRALAGGHDTIPVGAVPLKQFAGNTAYAGGAGLAIWNHLFLFPSGESIIDRFTSWNTRWTGIDVNYSGRLTFRDAVLVGDLENYTGVAFATNRWTHDINISNLRAEGFETGIIAPLRRETLIWGGSIGAVRGIVVAKGHDTTRSLTVYGVAFPSLTPTQLHGRRQYDVYADAFGLGNFPDRPLDSYFSNDNVSLYLGATAVGRLYFYEQQWTAVPFPSATMRGIVPDEYLDKTNQALRVEFGLSFGGEVAPADVTQLPDIHGWLRT
jgi:hypothetical protein